MSRYMVIGSKRKAHNQSQFYRVMNLSITKTVCLIMSNRVGITVYGYAEATPGSWRFQIDNEAPQELLLPSDARLCRAIKDRQDLNVGNHRVTLTPFTTSFVLTKFRYVYFQTRLSRPCYYLFQPVSQQTKPQESPKSWQPEKLSELQLELHLLCCSWRYYILSTRDAHGELECNEILIYLVYIMSLVNVTYVHAVSQWYNFCLSVYMAQ